MGTKKKREKRKSDTGKRGGKRGGVGLDKLQKQAKKRAHKGGGASWESGVWKKIVTGELA